ncbi:hypothetical protein CAPTEDRAFT_194687, partial [Capitella teleta]
MAEFSFEKGSMHDLDGYHSQDHIKNYSQLVGFRKFTDEPHSTHDGFESRLVVPTAGIQTITPIVSGAIVASEEPVMEIAGYADVFVQLTENHLADNRWSFICSKLNYQIEARSHMYAGELRSLDTLVQKRIEDIKHRISKTDRNRRGLFDFVGDIASSLFGIPSASDVRTLKEANERLADAVEGVVQHERQITAK